ncbi:unnamed protein product, partial [Allacma fusca]
LNAVEKQHVGEKKDGGEFTEEAHINQVEKERLCHKCKQPGHIARNCTNKSNYNSSSGRGHECSNKNTPGNSNAPGKRMSSPQVYKVAHPSFRPAPIQMTYDEDYNAEKIEESS